MILYYAIGGGWGHFSRGMAFANSLNIDLHEITFLTTPLDIPVPDHYHVIQLPKDLPFNKASFIPYLNRLIERIQPDRIIIDAFPQGIMKELAEINFSGRVDYVARRIKWENYSLPAKIRNLHAVYVCEELEPPHLNWIENNNVCQQNLSLRYPDIPIEIDLHKLLHSNKPNVLVVHSGSASETRVLLKTANNKSPNSHVVLAAPPKILMDIPEYPGITVFPAYALFDYFDLIVTGAGFNLIQQTKAYRSKHVSIAFERRFDDQYWRREQTIMI